MTTTTTSFASRVDQAIAGLPPGYFALVMATGIVSIGLREAGFDVASRILMGVAVVAYVLLAVLFVIRGFRHRERLRADARNPEVAFGFFTIVAGTGVLAVGLGENGWESVSVVLLSIAAVIWFVLGYVLPWQVLMARDGEPILARINGSWFVWSVASQSLAVGLTGVDVAESDLAGIIGILTVLSWSVGTILYAAIAVLVLLRIVHFGITPQQFEPTYWVAMGALAISVVAGASIVAMDPVPMVDVTRGFIGGTAAIFWCFAAWLIPLLVGAGVWRHFMRGVPLRYVPTLWSMVFPLGMFAVASMRLGRVEGLPTIETFGIGFLGVAVAAWVLVASSLLVRIVRGAIAR